MSGFAPAADNARKAAGYRMALENIANVTFGRTDPQVIAKGARLT